MGANEHNVQFVIKAIDQASGVFQQVGRGPVQVGGTGELADGAEEEQGRPCLPNEIGEIWGDGWWHWPDRSDKPR